MPEFTVRTNLPVSQVGAMARQSAAEVDGQLRISKIQTLNKTVNDYLEREHLPASLSSIFGVIALILATIGIYGVIAYGVTRRASEIGLRIALGAARAQVLRMVLTEATVIPLAGMRLFSDMPHSAWTEVFRLSFDCLSIRAAGEPGRGSPGRREKRLMSTRVLRKIS
jgi:hypothetical protein